MTSQEPPEGHAVPMPSPALPTADVEEMTGSKTANRAVPVPKEPGYHPTDRELADVDMALFHGPQHVWRHLRMISVTLLVLGTLMTGAGATHLATMSSGTIDTANTLPRNTPVAIHLNAGEERMLYSQRGSGEASQCIVTGPDKTTVPVVRTGPVILQGSDLLWNGSSMFTAPQAGDYTVLCKGGTETRAGHPVGTWDVVLTLVGTGLGGMSILGGLSCLWWAYRSRSSAA
ncbi:hypothetical protein KEM60_00413 [Austwickia sp. TVS 96-490-7B]|uniref:hypothetical protein n=1 Tax=Austwickia sp. TVS 96-490-7B TaxID=2830843 RepID=UPI001C55E577|nr:hypothetical protein [Austwickia sp. TVS 96-490-7B]MBW3084227.1 hypothetical protein [Austwickia sp. TVS 96-490-7B]